MYGPPHPGTPTNDLSVSRQLHPDEALDRALSMRRAALWPLFGYILVPVLIVAVLAVGAATDWSLWWMGVMLVLTLLLVGGSIGLGLVLGKGVARSHALHELGASGVLTAHWSEAGVRVQSENFTRTIPYADIRAIRQVGRFLVFRLRVVSLATPYYIALPPDFVPEAGLQRALAAGAKDRRRPTA